MLKLLPTIEKCFVVTLILGMALPYVGVDLPQLVLVSLAGLGTIYFAQALLPSELPLQEDEDPLGFRELLNYSIIPKVLAIGTSVVTMGILLYLIKAPGYLSMIGIGCTTIFCATGIYFLNAIGIKQPQAILPLFYRSTPLFLAGVYIYLQETPGVLG